jgi:ubiquinone/menaquinone biosynthesis C-methylase UbiE
MEVGPGSGIYLGLLSELADEVIAVDIEDAYLSSAAAAASWPNLKLVRDDICHSNMPDATMDLILCSEVVEHIPDSSLAIREMYRLLKPGGSLILTTPQRTSTMELTCKLAFLPIVISIVRWIYREPVLKPGHINLMTARTVTGQLESAGFRICERYKLALYLPVVAELMGNLGLRMQQWLERNLRDGALDGALWTQCYVAQRPVSSE